MKIRTLALAVLAAFVVPACGGGDAAPGDPPAPSDPAPRLHQLYVFRSPVNASNTVLVLTLNPRAGLDHPTSFSRGQRVLLHLDLDCDLAADLTLEPAFGAVADDGSQSVSLRSDGVPIAQGRTGEILPVSGGGFGGGQFYASLADDPLFADRIGLTQFQAEDTFPRSPATNFYGPTSNCLALVLEVPSADLGANNDGIQVWATAEADGLQIDRLGRPFVIDLIVPPLPTGSLPDDRAAWRSIGAPATDVAVFGTDVLAAHVGFYARTPADATALTDLWLPDVLIFQLGNPNGYATFITPPNFAGTHLGNGRRLRDDALDSLVTILTNGSITTDNVPDDNGMRVTDGNLGTVAAFPYVGVPN